MIRVRDNASTLLQDAELLRRNGRICRAYALAYIACEEAGKLSILLGAATRLILGIPVDWKTTRRRFRSHESKASQFMGLANAMPLILAAAGAEKRTVDVDEIMMKAAAGVLVGPALFAKRNASIYCDFSESSFTSPSDQIDDEMTGRMIEYATQHIAAAKLILGNSAEEAATKLAERASRDRYDSAISRAAEEAELVESALTAFRRSNRPKSG